MAVATALVGWVIAGYLVFKFRGKRTKKEELTPVEYISYIKKLHDKQYGTLQDLNEKYNSIISDLNKERIQDMKDLAQDYNELASNTLRTLDKLIEQFGPKNPEQKNLTQGDLTDGDD